MLNKKRTIIILIAIIQVECSRVIDKHKQALYVSDYCKEIGVCTEGSHVMCTHYNPKRKMGPNCVKTKNVTVTDEYAEVLLDLINGVRSKVARGQAVGYEQQKLPRGYGMYRVKWDPELATLAQVWANQCIFDTDECRATKKFEDPGQAVVLTLYTEPEWQLLSKRYQFKRNGYMVGKVKYGLFSGVRSWHSKKSSVTADNILGRGWEKSLNNNQYLQMVYGPVTHIGCGVSTFQSFLFMTQTKDLIFNLIRVVCNFSIRLRKGKVYTTEAPTEVGYTVKCGCPLGYDEDPDCLCYESGRGLPYSCKYGQCMPHVVVLPIITVEDAPPHKLATTNSSNQKTKAKLLKENVKVHRNCSHPKRRTESSLFSKPIFVLPTRKVVENTRSVDEKDNKSLEETTKIVQSRLLNTNLFLNKNSNILQNEQGKSSEVDGTNRTVDSIENLNHSDFKDDCIEIKLPLRNLNIVGYEEPDERIIDLLNEIEAESRHVRLNEREKYILGHKIQNIYSAFLEKSKRTAEREKPENVQEKKIENYNDFDTFDYESDELYQFEDEVKRIKEYNDIILEPINARDHMYNLQSRNTLKLRNRNDVNLLHIRNAYNHGKKDRVNYNFKNKVNNESIDEDLLSLNRRKYYQNKLDHLERKFQHLRNRKRMKEVGY